MRFSLFILLLCLVQLIGCNTKSTSPDTAKDGKEVTTTKEKVAAGKKAAEAEKTDTSKKTESDPSNEQPQSEWLAYPEDMDKRAADPYADVTQSASEGDASAMVKLAFFSQQIGTMLLRSGDEDLAYQFFAQGGKAMRRGMEEGADELPPESIIGEIYYNEACGLAKTGNIDGAMVALSDSIQNGFSDIELLETDEDLAEVRALDGFDSSLEKWKKLAEEKIKEHAREELSNGETFPFTFEATDVNGKEQSLEALKGKVVIVDVWGTWCPPCRAEIPSFIKLQKKYGDDGFQMIGLNYEGGDSEEEDKKTILEFMEEFEINYPCIVGDEETKEQIPDFGGYPTTLFIDKTGKVRMKAVGLHKYAFLDAVVSELLAE